MKRWYVCALAVLGALILTNLGRGLSSSPFTTGAMSYNIAAEPATTPTPGTPTTLVLPLVIAAEAQLSQQQLAATVDALVRQQAQQATEIAGWQEMTSYLLTQVPAQQYGPTVVVLAAQNAYLATRVAEVYTALGSPLPTPPAWPTFGPSPIPTRTPFTTVTPTPQ